VTREPLIEAMVAAVNPDSVLAFVRRLQKYRSRYSTSDSCRAAAQWIADKFRAYGCDTVYLQQHTTGHAPNVIGIKYGTSGLRNPYAIIDGHFDTYPPDTVPGADDNASGVLHYWRSHDPSTGSPPWRRRPANRSILSASPWIGPAMTTCEG
jgi:hypothetical protein